MVTHKGKIVGALILAIIWVCAYLLAGPGALLTPTSTAASIPLFITLAGVATITLYHVLYPSNAETNKLSLTSVLTIIWLALILFYPYKDPNNSAAGAVGFFTLVGGLAICILWIHFLVDENA